MRNTPGRRHTRLIVYSARISTPTTGLISGIVLVAVGAHDARNKDIERVYSVLTEEVIELLIVGKTF